MDFTCISSGMLRVKYEAENSIWHHCGNSRLTSSHTSWYNELIRQLTMLIMCQAKKTPANKRLWTVRALVALVMAWNLSAAIPYMVNPGGSLHSFQVSGIGGALLIRGLGILFLMWQVPYVPVLIHPANHRVIFLCVLVIPRDSNEHNGDHRYTRHWPGECLFL